MKKKVKKMLILLLVISLMILNLDAVGWSQEDPTHEGYNAIDLILARPLGIAAGIIGTGIFILSLPFTIPTKSLDDASKLFIIEPFNFSFVREFPDGNM